MQKRGSLTQSALGEILIAIRFISWQVAQKQGIGEWPLLIDPRGKKAFLSLDSRRIQMTHVIFGKVRVAVEWLEQDLDLMKSSTMKDLYLKIKLYS